MFLMSDQPFCQDVDAHSYESPASSLWQSHLLAWANRYSRNNLTFMFRQEAGLFDIHRETFFPNNPVDSYQNFIFRQIITRKGKIIGISRNKPTRIHRPTPSFFIHRIGYNITESRTGRRSLRKKTSETTKVPPKLSRWNVSTPSP